MSINKIGFIGVGIMGKSMVYNLVKSGYEVHIYARNKVKVMDVIEKGIPFYETIADCVKECDAVITMVGYPEDVEDVYFGEGKIMESVRENTYLIDMTTTSPQIDKKIADKAQMKNLHVLDAPVTGGDRGAKEGTLSILVGGSQDDYKACMPLFKAMGKSIKYSGSVGAGQHAKITTQILQAGIMAGIAEALSYAKSANLDIQTVLEGAYEGNGGSKLLNLYGERIKDGDFEPGFFIDFFIKDMKLGYEGAEKEGLDLEVLKHIIDIYESLSEKGMGKLGMQAIMKYYE